MMRRCRCLRQGGMEITCLCSLLLSLIHLSPCVKSHVCQIQGAGKKPSLFHQAGPRVIINNSKSHARLSVRFLCVVIQTEKVTPSFQTSGKYIQLVFVMKMQIRQTACLNASSAALAVNCWEWTQGMEREKDEMENERLRRGQNKSWKNKSNIQSWQCRLRWDHFPESDTPPNPLTSGF